MGRAFPSFSIWKSMQFQTQSGTNIKDEYYHTATRTLLNSNIKKQKHLKMVLIAVSFGEIHAEAPKNAQINNSRKKR